MALLRAGAESCDSIVRLDEKLWQAATCEFRAPSGDYWSLNRAAWLRHVLVAFYCDLTTSTVELT